MRIIIPDICALGLSFEIGGFRLLFAIIATYMWFMTTLFSKEYMSHAGKKGRYYFFLAITYVATTALFLSGDLYTTFIFFEIMSVASYVCVIHDENELTLRAGGVYLAVAVIGGLVSLMGIFLLHHMFGTLTFEELKPLCEALLKSGDADAIRTLFIAGGCILFGYGAKAGMFPLHIWLPMAHPVAPAPASALLSGIITKTGIFGLLVLSVYVFPGNGQWGFIIVMLGVVTMLLGGILAIFSVDIKRTLACSSMSQLGMIIVGIGMMDLLGEENTLAARGTVMHMVNHACLKLVLFMAAGVIVMNLHKLNLNEIRGYGRKKPFLKLVFLSGSLGIAGIPFFNGYISKTLLHESIVEYIEVLSEQGSSNEALFRVIEWLFLITGAMTLAYMTKLFICVFVEKNVDADLQAEYDEGKPYCTPLTKFVLAITAFVMPVFGVLSKITIDIIGDMGQGFLGAKELEHQVNYFSLENLKGGLISILLGALIYLVFIRRVLLRNEDGREVYADIWPKKLDLLTLFYEPVIMVILPAVIGFICRCLDFALDGVILFLRQTTHKQVFKKEPIPAKFFMAHILGSLMNRISSVASFFMGEKVHRKKNYVLVLAGKKTLMDQTTKMVSASSAFSLMMFAIGIIAVVVYILVV